MKKAFIALFALSFIITLKAQDVKPHFAAIHFSPVFESIKKIKTGFGSSIEGAYFINEWFGAGGIARFSQHSYTYSRFDASGNASQFGLTGNVYMFKKFFNDKLTILPSMGIGFTSMKLPNGNLTKTEIQETAPGVFSEVDVVQAIPAINVMAFTFNVFSVDCNYQFKPNMAAGIKLDYQIAVSNKWPDETLCDFLSFGIGYTYFFGIK